MNGLEAKNSETCKKTLRQWVLEGPFSIITHKSPPWKMGATQFEWITSKKIRNLHEKTKAMGFIRSIFHYYTQITHFENGGQKICIVSPTPDLKTKDSKFRPEQPMRTGLETNNSKFSLEPLYCDWNELLLLFIPNKLPPRKGDQEICMVYPPFSSQKWVLKTKILKLRPEPLMRT